jgi:uncharacterized protein YggE
MMLYLNLSRLIPQQGWLRFALAMLLLSLLVANSARAASEMMPVRSITASGIAERKVAPDEAHVSVTVGATHMKLEVAKAEHDKKLRDVMAIAKKAGIDDAQMKTLNSSTQPQYTWENNKQNFKGYRVATTLDLTVKKIDAVGGLLEKLSAAGLESGNTPEWGNLINVSYSVANPDKVRDEMLAEAIKNARKKAENMASAAGASIGNVIQITEGGAPQFDFPVPMMAHRKGAILEMAAADSMETAPPAGEQVVNANVTVVFELK